MFPKPIPTNTALSSATNARRYPLRPLPMAGRTLRNVLVMTSVSLTGIAASGCASSAGTSASHGVSSSASTPPSTAADGAPHAAGKQMHQHQHQHQGPQFQSPENFVGKWNAAERDSYQKPDEIIAAMGIGPGDTVVDLGAGTGYLLPSLAKAVGPTGRVIALDIEPEMIRFLNETIAKNGWTNVTTHLGAEDSPQLHGGAPVDAVVTLNVWHHVGQRPAYAQKLRESMVAGGTFVVVDFLPEQTEGFGPPLKMRLSSTQVVDDLVAAGFAAEVIDETLPRHYIVRGRVPTPPGTTPVKTK